MSNEPDLRTYLADLAAELIEKIKKEDAYRIRMQHALTKQWGGVGELGSRLADDMTREAAQSDIGWYRIPTHGDSFNKALREAMETAGKEIFLGLCSDDPDIREMASDKLSAKIVQQFDAHHIAVTRRRRRRDPLASSATVLDISKRSKRS
jgi:hypothetical protein